MQPQKKRHRLRLTIILVILLILLSYIMWIYFFYYPVLEDWTSFNSALSNCDNGEFIGGEQMIFQYKIQGLKNENCFVNVKLLQGELNNQDSKKLEGSEMTCEIPQGNVILPESNIANCHGLLKEGLQDLIINKLHTYIVKNLGRINLELLQPGNFTAGFI